MAVPKKKIFKKYKKIRMFTVKRTIQLKIISDRFSKFYKNLKKYDLF